MSCGSQQPNEDLAKLKKIPASECTYPNIQQLPADEDTRGAFTNQKPDTLICSADFSALKENNFPLNVKILVINLHKSNFFTIFAPNFKNCIK